MNLNRHFGETLKKVIDKRQMSQTDLAKLLGVTKAAVTSYIKAKSPHDTTANRILIALNITEEEFFSSEREASEFEQKLLELENRQIELERKLRIANEELMMYQRKEIKELREEVNSQGMPTKTT